MTPDLPLWANLILGIAAVLVGLATIWRYVLPACKGMWRLMHGTYSLIEDFRDTGGFAGIASVIRDLAVDLAHVKVLAERADHELHPNKGMSLRDSVTRSEQGISDLRQQVAAVTDQATAISERQEILRRADESTAADLKEFLERDYRDTQEANQHLRASVNELLAITDEPEEP